MMSHLMKVRTYFDDVDVVLEAERFQKNFLHVSTAVVVLGWNDEAELEFVRVFCEASDGIGHPHNDSRLCVSLDQCRSDVLSDSDCFEASFAGHHVRIGCFSNHHVGLSVV